MAAGGNPKGNKKTAAAWQAIYINFKDYKSPELYYDIMDQRHAFWSARKLAPFWYWYARPVNDDSYAFPSQHPYPMELELDHIVANLIRDINFETDEIRVEIEYEKFAEDRARDLLQDQPKTVPTPREPVVVIKLGGRDTSQEEVRAKLASGEYVLTKKYAQDIGGKIIIIQSIQRSVGRTFTGSRLEFPGEHSVD